MDHDRECIFLIAQNTPCSTYDLSDPGFPEGSSFADVAGYDSDLSFFPYDPYQQAADTDALMARLAAENAPPPQDRLAYFAEAQQGHNFCLASWQMEDSIWSQPWARTLEFRGSNCYDCCDMPERDYTSMMHWLYANGFQVSAIGHRNLVDFTWEDIPPRPWTPTRAPRPTHPLRFCSRCTDTPAHNCQYEHGDVIPRLNPSIYGPCRFGLSCGSGDPAKRASCLYLHPGETWTEGMVLTRKSLT